MRNLLKIAAFICFSLYAVSVSAEWRVDVESKTVAAGKTGVTVDITIYNDLPAQVSIPIVIRELSDPPIGAYWMGTLPLYCEDDNHGVVWFLDSGEGTMRAVCPPALEPCDALSPDNLTIDVGPLHSTPDGRVRLRLTFDVSNVVGQFEFDASGDVFMIDDQYVPHIASFNKGIITIVDCDCSMLGDLNLDGAINPVDMVLLVNHVYLGMPLPEELPACITPIGDWNCDGNVNPIDVVFMVRYVYLGSPTLPCDPCLGEKLPDLMIGENDYYFNPNPAVVNEPVWVWVKVNNIGWETAYAPTLDIYAGDPAASGTLLGTGTLDDIPPSGSSGYYGGQFTFTSPGPVEIYGIADFGGLIVESNENNNQNHQTLEVIGSGIAKSVPGTAVSPCPVELLPRK